MTYFEVFVVHQSHGVSVWKSGVVLFENQKCFFRIDLMRCRQVKLHVAKRCHTVTWTIALVVTDVVCYRFAVPSELQMIEKDVERITVAMCKR